MNNRRKPLNRSITIGCVLFIIALCVLLVLANLKTYRDYVYEDYRGYIKDILYYTQDHIDGDDTQKCIETGKESRKYKDTLLFMDGIMDHFDDVHYFYVIKPLNTNDTGNMLSVFSAERYKDRYIDTEGNLYLGWISEDEFDAATAKKFMNIMNGDGITYFEESTEWGTDYTGAMPLKDSQGRGIAVLAVDIDISFLDSMILEYALVNISVVFLAGLIFICVFLFWSRRNITRPIRQLEESAAGFVDRSSGQRDVAALNFEAPQLEKNNEIKSLSDAVVKMTENMREYVTDIIDAETKAANMKELANRDALTGVFNKTAYDEAARLIESQMATEAESEKLRVGLAVVDLNRLKYINDNYGHDKGNFAICKLCQMVCRIFPESAVYRIGGDEFIILLQGEDYDQYDHRTKQLEQEMDVLVQDESLQPWERVSAAVGVAFYDKALDENLGGVFKRADRKMYNRKKEMEKE